MKRKKDGGKRGSAGRKIMVLECPQCGCPNRPKDRLCMYCNAELKSTGVTVKMAVEYYANYLRDFLASGNAVPYLYLLLTVAIAVLMTSFGVWFIVSGVKEGGMINWALGTLLLLYGVAALGNAYNTIRKS